MSRREKEEAQEIRRLIAEYVQANGIDLCGCGARPQSLTRLGWQTLFEFREHSIDL